MKGIKGGYHPDGRLEAARDEIAMEMMGLVSAGSIEDKRRALKEAVRLTRQYIGLLGHMNGGQPPLALAGA